MPTLIRLLVVLLILGGLAYGGMVGLVMTVEPPDKLETIRIPTRDLVPQPNRDPLVRREIDTTRTAPAVEPDPEPQVESDVPPPTESPDAEGVVTLQPGNE